jgi:hypothetical protein
MVANCSEAINFCLGCKCAEAACVLNNKTFRIDICISVVVETFE